MDNTTLSRNLNYLGYECKPIDFDELDPEARHALITWLDATPLGPLGHVSHAIDARRYHEWRTHIAARHKADVRAGKEEDNDLPF